MAIVARTFAISIMALILIFSLIHLGVSIGIIVPYKKYGGIFRPQVGLSAFNIVISFFGFVTGISGLTSIWLGSERFGRIVCFISGILGILALASLVAAIIINAKSLSYVSSNFSNDLIAYGNSPDASMRIDLLQYKYQCCGTDMWVDWAGANLNATSPVKGTTNTVNITLTTTTTTTTIVSTTSVTTTTSISTSAMQNIATNQSRKRNVKRDETDISNDPHRRQSRELADHSRKERQVILSGRDIAGLPLSFPVTLPRSCCISGALLTSNASNAYCISNANNAVNHFNTAGCAKPIDITAGNQAMGFGVINSFMIVLAFVAIPLMLGNPSVSI